jgi:seryl-tRNA synthetase
MVALLEQFQMPDGTVAVPEVLRPYCGFDTITSQELLSESRR